jgi:putative oxidoreductase
MKKISSLLRLDFLPCGADLGLLVLRLWFGGSLLALHGWGKLTGFHSMSAHFTDPFHIGARNSLALSLVAEFFCSALVIFGLFGRLAALGVAVNLVTAFYFVHNLALKGNHSGELAFIYLGGFLVLLIAGPGRFSLDGQSAKGGGKSAPKPRPPRD